MKKEKGNGKTLWMPVCMSIGIGLGLAIGSQIGQTPACLSIGIGLGLAVGGIIDRISNADRNRNS